MEGKNEIKFTKGELAVLVSNSCNNIRGYCRELKSTPKNDLEKREDISHRIEDLFLNLNLMLKIAGYKPVELVDIVPREE